MHWTPVVSPILLWFSWENMKTACALRYTDHLSMKRGGEKKKNSLIPLKIFTFQICLKVRQSNNCIFVPVIHFKHKNILQLFKLNVLWLHSQEHTILLNIPNESFYRYFRLGSENLITWLSLLKQPIKLLSCLRLWDLATYLRQLIKRSMAPTASEEENN